MQGTNNPEVSATNRAEIKKKKNDRSIKKSLLSDIKVPSNEAQVKYKIEKAGHTESKSDLNWQTSSSDYLSNEDDNNSLIFEKQVVESPPVSSQKLLSVKLPKKSYHSYRKHHEPKNRRLLIQPDTSVDIEYDDSDGNVPIARILYDTLQNEKSLSLTEELIAKQANLIAKISKTVKKNLSSRHRNEKGNIKDDSR